MTSIDRSLSAAELHDRLVNFDESEQIEAKRASAVGSSIMETVCAFANEPGLGGGYLLLGVVREEMALFPSYEVAGVANADKLASDLATRCRTEFNAAVRVDIRPDKIGTTPVLVVFVPESPARDKPVYFKSQGLPRGAYRRIGPTDQRCTDDDLEVFFSGRRHESFDSTPLPDTSLADVDPDALTEYRQVKTASNPEAEELRWKDEDLLVALNCARMHEGRLVLTVAGALLFGRPMALRRLFPMVRVDYIRVPGREWVPDPEKRFESIELRDPLMRLVRRATVAVMDDLPKAFSLPEGQLQRQDIYPIPQRVIREAVVNAVMHRNYRVHGPIQIIRYSNRLEITNPGFSLKSPEHLGEPGSQPRNPAIAAVLHETGFAETKGSGIRVMREMMGRAGLTPPTFDSDRTQDEFTARYLFHHFLGPEDLAWLSRFKDLALSDEEAKALIWVREVGAVDNSTYRELNRVDTLSASKKLQRLRDAGLLLQRGKGPATYYVPGPGLLAAGQGVGNGSPDMSGNLPDSGESLPDLDPSLPDLTGSSPDLADSSPDLAGSSPDLGPGIDPGLLQIADPVRNSGRAPQQLVREVILALCRGRFLSLRDLSVLLNRQQESLRGAYISQMVRDGSLELLHPEAPNHPSQAYRTKA